MASQARLIVVFCCALLAGFASERLLFHSHPVSSVSTTEPYNTGATKISKLDEQLSPEKTPKISVHGLNELVSEMRSLSMLLKGVVQKQHPGPSASHVPVSASLTNVRSSATPVKREIISFGNSKCLDSNSAYANNGVKVYTCNQGLGQSFWITSTGFIRHGTGNCIDSAGPGLVQMAYCSKKESTLWDLIGGHSLGASLRNRQTGLCLDIRISDDTITASPCDNSCTQRWIVSHLQGLFPTQPAQFASTVEVSHNERILCWILVEPGDNSLSVAVNRTWGRLCDILLFVDSRNIPSLNTFVVLPTAGSSTTPTMWYRTQQALMHLYHHYRTQAEWFLKADDDTFVIVKHLREFVADKNPDTPAQFGRKLQYNGNKGEEHAYISGGSGVLLSRGALSLVGETVDQNPQLWEGPLNGPADLLMSKTLFKLGVTATDTRDLNGRQRFFPIGLESERTITRAKNGEVWLWRYSPEMREGPNCCSSKWIGTHYLKEHQMFTLHGQLEIGCKTSPTVFPFLESSSNS